MGKEVIAGPEGQEGYCNIWQVKQSGRKHVQLEFVDVLTVIKKIKQNGSKPAGKGNTHLIKSMSSFSFLHLLSLFQFRITETM